MNLAVVTTAFMTKSKIESEKLVERKLVELCKLNGGMCIKLLSFHINGLPDRMCLFWPAKVVFVELKTTKQKARPLQVAMHNKLRKLGFRVEVIDTVEQVENLINEIMAC